MKTFETLSDALGVEHKPAEPEILPPAVIEESKEEVGSEDQRADYELSRKTFRDLIHKGNIAIEGITDLAKQSESPRAYEVLATLMKTVADTTKDLYDLQKKTKDLQNKGVIEQKNDQIMVEKAVFVGTTADLLKQIKENKQ